MNGAEAFVRTVVAAGVEVCLANPGTSELAFVAAMDAAPGLRGVLGLFEGVCTGAADGYGRMADRPALALLHHGPGLGNGLANLHNAHKALSPVVVVVGDGSNSHNRLHPPLHSDITGLAAPVSNWVRRTVRSVDLARDAAAAIAAATGPPGDVATLIVPADVQWGEAGGPAAPVSSPRPAHVSEERILDAAEALRDEGPTALLLGGSVLREPGLRIAARIAARTGCVLLSPTLPARVDRGPHLPPVQRIPYFPELALRALAGFRTLVLAGATEPVTFFDYPPTGGRLLSPETVIRTLATPAEDAEQALEALAAILGAERAVAPTGRGARPDAPSGPLTPETLSAALAAALPKGAILTDEGVTSGRPFWSLSSGCPAHTVLCVCGGAIGLGLPLATGAAIACPDRPVIALEADGSALYTPQALWTQAREQLNVTTVLCANHRYRILQVELERAGVPLTGPASERLTDLGSPRIDWLQLAGAMGVPAVRVETAEDLAREVTRSAAEPGPRLIEAALA